MQAKCDVPFWVSCSLARLLSSVRRAPPTPAAAGLGLLLLISDENVQNQSADNLTISDQKVQNQSAEVVLIRLFSPRCPQIIVRHTHFCEESVKHVAGGEAMLGFLRLQMSSDTAVTDTRMRSADIRMETAAAP